MGHLKLLHDKFSTTSTSPFILPNLLDTSLEADPLKLIHKMVAYYNARLLRNTADNTLHNAYRTLLCYQYQCQSAQKLDRNNYRNDILFENLRRVLFTFSDVPDDSSTIHDISVLQIVFYLNTDKFNSLFLEAIKLINSQVDPKSHVEKNYPLIEVFLDSTILRKQLFTSPEKIAIAATELLDIMEIWCYVIDQDNAEEWSPLVSLFLKGLSADIYTIDEAWAFIAYQSSFISTYQKSLALLHGSIDTLLSAPSTEALSINIKYCTDEEVLLPILGHLTSHLQHCRKQAQSVLKKLVGYLQAHSADIPLSEINQFQPPFIFCKDQDFSIEEIQTKYFNVLECLEENEAHLVLPTMRHLKHLVKTTITQAPCLNETWLKCIFTRLLTHKNRTVMQCGLVLLFQMDLQIFNDGVMSLLIDTLDDPSVYDHHSPDPQPRLVHKLWELFARAEESGINITSKFILAASKIDWSPIPLFYVFEALGSNQQVKKMEHNVWATAELQALLTITKDCTPLLIRILKVPIQINILRCIMLYVRPPVDFLLMGKIFFAVDRNDVLVRGSVHWELLVDYLQKLMAGPAGLDIPACCEQVLSSDDSTDVESLAILCVLVCDAENAVVKASITSHVLSQAFIPIMDASRDMEHFIDRVYKDSSSFHKSLTIITALLKLAPRDYDTYVLLIFGFAKAIFDFIRNSLKSHWPPSFEAATIYVDVCSAFLTLRDVSVTFRTAIEAMMVMAEEDIERITDFVVHDTLSMTHTWYALSILYLTNNGADFLLAQALPRFTANADNKEIVDESYGLLGKIYQRHLDSSELPGALPEFLMTRVMALAKAKSDHAMGPILGIIRTSLVQKRDDDCAIIRNVLNICWTRLWEMDRTAEFWITAKEMMSLLLDERFLQRDTLKQFTLDKIGAIISKTASDSELRYMLFVPMQTMPESSFLFCDAILTALLQTNPKDVDKSMLTCCHIVKQYPINVNQGSFQGTALELGIYMDVKIRSVLIALILQLNKTSQEQFSKTYVPQLTSLLDTYKDERYSENSRTHRLKYRIMQVALVLGNDTMYDYLSRSFFVERDQRSVRILKEWILIQFYLRNPTKRDDVWKLINEAQRTCPQGFVSFASIVYHVARCLKNDRSTYVRKAVTCILPSCFSQQFRVRLYAQAIVPELLKMVKNEFKGVRQSLEDSLRYGDGKSISARLLDDFYFKAFNAQSHFTLQTIFYEFPRLTGVCVDEWIRPEIFEGVIHQSLRLGVAIYNDDPSLSVIGNPEEESNGSEAEVCTETNVGSGQKTPASGAAPKQRSKDKDAGLIVIATLVDRFTNLGGLASMAEIFRARELILKKKCYVENKEFQDMCALSNSPMTVSEVQSHQLREYLLAKRTKGWKVVGVAPKENSGNLLKMQFNKKTILLLGNEKHGIPANLVQLVDAWVEIQADGSPSHNVQATCAICLSMYAQQHLY